LAGKEWEVYFNDKEKAHTFVSENLMAIVMPMQETGQITVEESPAGPDFRDITP
jgi:hypothetical protein